MATAAVGTPYKVKYYTYLPTSRRLNVTRSYPVKSSSGAVPLLLGHESGILVLWSGESASSGSVSSFASFELPLDAAVIDIAVPSVPSFLFQNKAFQHDRRSVLLTTHAVVAVSCSNGTVKLVELPLDPPNLADKQTAGAVLFERQYAEIQTSVSLSWDIRPLTPIADEDSSSGRFDTRSDVKMLVASCSNDGSPTLHITSVTIADVENSLRATHSKVQKVPLPLQPLRVAFRPGPQDPAVLVACGAGHVYIYQPYTVRSHEFAGGVHTRSFVNGISHCGSFGASFCTPFSSLKRGSSHGSAARKRIVDAGWVTQGDGVIVLLADRTWGIWKISRAQGLPDSEFDAVYDCRSDPHSPRTPAPLFSGGISINSVIEAETGKADDSLIIWFGDTVHIVKSVQDIGIGRHRSQHNPSPPLQVVECLLHQERDNVTQLHGFQLRKHNIVSVDLFDGVDSDLTTLKRYPIIITEHNLIFSNPFTVATTQPRISLTKRSISAAGHTTPDPLARKRWIGMELPTPIKLFRKPVEVLPPNTPARYANVGPINRKRSPLTVSEIENVLGVIERQYRTKLVTR